MKSLVKTGIIDKNVIGLIYSEYSWASRIHVGGYDESYKYRDRKTKEVSTIQWTPMKGSMKYEIDFKGLHYGDYELTNGTSRAIIDNFARYVSFPEPKYNELIAIFR